MSLINIADLTFRYDGSYDNIFENVSFQIDTDWKLGFIGRNGRGKTTFLNLLQGKYEYSGSITENVKFEYFPYEVSDMDLITSDVINEIDGSLPDWKINRELSKLSVSEEILYRPFRTLSNGERTKVMLAALFLRENSFLLIDEPTNHLDAAGREIVADYLKGKSGFILVSHDRTFLDSCVDHILSINKMNIEILSGNFSSWYQNKQLQDNFELAENERLKKDIKRLETAARQSKDWADKVEASKIGFNPLKEERFIGSRSYIGEQSRRMQQRRKNLERRQSSEIEEKSKLLKNIESIESLKIHPLRYHSQRIVQAANLTTFYSEKQVCRNVSFSVSQCDRIAFTGINGCGKSTLLKLICGEIINYTGDLFVAGGLAISYVPQDTSFLRGSLDNYASEYKIDIPLFKAILRKLDFTRIQFDKDMSSFSAGQKKKVLIARSLCESAHLYIWDEPLNYIDIFSRIQIGELLLEYKPAILFVEHDKAFCNSIATKTVVIGEKT